jgi:hypothetical protein
MHYMMMMMMKKNKITYVILSIHTHFSIYVDNVCDDEEYTTLLAYF